VTPFHCECETNAKFNVILNETNKVIDFEEGKSDEHNFDDDISDPVAIHRVLAPNDETVIDGNQEFNCLDDNVKQKMRFCSVTNVQGTKS